MASRVLILGGAGFVGSNIVSRFVEDGSHVTVLDGLLDRTGGRIKNLSRMTPRLRLIQSRIDQTDELPELIKNNDVIVDSMAWTSHHAALKDPLYDLELNLRSHLYLLSRIEQEGGKPTRIIYLGSRGQYGNPDSAEITEETPMMPVDIQGIHKTGAESYFRVYAGLKKIDVCSLRFPNCFGRNQPTSGPDIGLVGSFIRDLLQDKTIQIYGENRRRFLVFARDLADSVSILSNRVPTGFSAFNLRGHETTLEKLVQMLIEIIGKGRYEKKDLPAEIQAIDPGNAYINDRKLHDYLGKLTLTDLRQALADTVNYFTEEMQ